MAATQPKPNLNRRIRIDRSSMSWNFALHASGRSPRRTHQRQSHQAFANVLNERSQKTRFLNANFAPLSMVVRHPAPNPQGGFHAGSFGCLLGHDAGRDMVGRAGLWGARPYDERVQRQI
jgi:hypothetical protein